MADIEITLPTVQYGNVKITATPEEWGLDSIADAPDVGVWAATYLNLFAQGFKHGATMDVDAHLGAPQGDPVDLAQRALDKGLGGVTEVRSVEQIMSDEDVDTIDQARKIQEQEVSAPWAEKVNPKPKPWETEATAPAVLDAAW